MSLQTDLQKMEQEFKSVFPNANFASLIDKHQEAPIYRFLFDKYNKLIFDNEDSIHYSQVDDHVSQIDNLNPEIANNAATLYSLDKARCYVLAVSYYKFSNDGLHNVLDSGILGVDKPISGYVVYGGYLDGKHLEISDKSTEAEWQTYLVNSFASCADQYPFASLFDAEIEQFKAEIHGKILASFSEQVNSEL
jgi:hypothetical protein